MLSPEQQWRDEVLRRLPDGSYARVDGVVPRAELDRALDALRRERQACDDLRKRANLVAELERLILLLKERA